jgi:integrase
MAGKLRHWKERSGRYSARLIIPPYLRPYLDNRVELEIQLGGDKREALRNHAAAVASIQRQLGIARQKYETATGAIRAEPAYPLTAQQIALRDYQEQVDFDTALRAADSRYAQFGVDPEEARRYRDGFVGKLTDDELEELVGHRIAVVRLAGNTQAIKGTDEWRIIAQALCVSKHEALRREDERNEGDFTGQPSHPLLTEAIEADPANDAGALEFSALTFETVIKEQERITGMGLGGKEKAGSTLSKYRNAVQDFERHRDSKKVATVTLTEGEAWRDAMLNEGKLTRKTIRDKIAAIRAVLTWAQKQSKGKLFSNGLPFQFIDLPVAEGVDSAERTYSLKEARHFLEFTRKATRASFRWIPWIIAHTGARVNEITPLEKADVFEVEGRWFIHIRVGNGRTTKTGKARKVPVHPALEKEGFIDFVKAAPDGKLFPGGKNEDQRIREWIHEKVFPKRTDMPPPNHGFRHLFEDALFGEVNHKAALYITGRSSGSSADDYGGSDLKLLELARQMDKVKPII